MNTVPIGHRLRFGRSIRSLLAVVLAASGLAFVAVNPSSAQVGGPVIDGDPCALGEGVTVVVDFTDEAGDADIVVGCAPGEQTTGFAALTAAGFDHESDASGFLCQVDGVPASGSPCDPQGFWSSWNQSLDGTWGFASTGFADGPVPVDTIVGLSWVSDWSTIDAVAPRTVIELVDDTTTTTTTTTSTSTTTTSTTTTTTVPDDEDCSIERTATEGIEAALDWLGCELEANGHVMPGYQGAPSWGLTADVLLAYATYGRGDHPVAVQALANFEASINSYISGVDFGSPDDVYAGPIGKALLTVASLGGDHDDFGGVDLDDALLARMVTEGDDIGRFSDVSEFGDYSNGLGQALGMMGLARTSGVPSEAVDFLLDQQCPGGGFRGDYTTSGGCTSDDDADIDYTAVAALALLEAPASTDVDDAIDSAVAWLLSRQQPSGAFTGTGITSVENTNSTGLVAMLLRATDEGAAADAAQAYVESAQITGPAADGVSLMAAGPADENVGAIAYDPATLAEALSDGISAAGLQQWHIASSQAVYVFGATTFGPAQAPPETPEDTTTTTAAPAPDQQPTVTDPAGSGGAGGTRHGGRSGSLPATGSDSNVLVGWGMALVLLGAVAVLGERTRRRRLIEADAR